VKEHRWFYELARPVLAFFKWLVLRQETRGVENIPATGSVILVSNHLHGMDILAVAVPSKRHLHFMAKVELFQVPVLGGLNRLIGAFPVRRGESDRESLRIAGEVLAAGQVLAIFPEGHRSDDHTLQKGHTGVALIALRSGAPIVPIGVWGTERALKGLRCGPWAPRVHVTYGEAFTLPPVGRRTREDLDRGLDTIMRRIAALLPEAYRGVYADAVAAPVGAAENVADVDVGGTDPLAAERALDREEAPLEPPAPAPSA
jgi:1-acyl-sn-glycerol-3-phosphate acyltransferase